MRAGALPRLKACAAALLAAVVVMAAAPAPRAAPADDRPLPRNDGWVTDLAGLLSPDEERALEARMDSYQRGTGQDIALLTVPDLAGEPIEDFARRVARGWKLGSVEKNDGALLVVSKGDREMRIEVGRGLEGTLTDAVSGRIIHDVITPQFQQGDFAAGLRLGIEALQKAAGGDLSDLPEPSRSPARHGSSFIPFGFFVVLMIVLIARRRRGGPGGRSRGSIWPWLVIANSMGRGSGGRGLGGGSGGFGGSFGGGGGSFGGFGGGGGFSGGGASGRW